MILSLIGVVLLIVGAVCDIFGAIGMHRFGNFYLRLHAATVGTVGGKFYPFIGAGLIALDRGLLSVAGVAFLSAFTLLITTSVGSHALAYAAERAGVVKIEHNELGGDWDD
ncbi:cation:proton antiporter [Thermococcus celericrescens]|uniref:Cation:proton antiporter n=1 Tax=Thermococcus celericrescens TaxID=227598 RepID=A0A100XWH3_9EURY|nr:monovalent cation/H(+) antiporter subunit G [Thermococcus celericrescens]KUH32426.1 cation:proton antiporter [Thermococcus celericrescens]